MAIHRLKGHQLSIAFYALLVLIVACSSVNPERSPEISKLDPEQEILVGQDTTTQIESQTATAPELPAPTSIGAIPTPDGYERITASPKSFGEYLRSVPLKLNSDTVFLYDGQPKYPQNVHHSILDIDVGKRDLQQCADAVMRLRGEFLYAEKRYDEIHFNFLSDGKPRYFKDRTDASYSYKSFRKYMDYIFSYANTSSLKKEMHKVDVLEMQIGDVFIQQGNPYGHAIIVVDMAKNESGQKVFMLAQSYMPAQDIHILKNLKSSDISPWYPVGFGNTLDTPEWTFGWADLKRF